MMMNADVLIGKNGATKSKQEGDGKTPIGIFELGIIFGTHERSEINLDKSIKYIKVTPNLYWVDDVNSIYYNQLVDNARTAKAWSSAEHLIEYPVQYEYAVEIKSNPENIPGKGSAIFLHCSNGKSTAGCVALMKEDVIKLLSKLDKNSKIIII